MSAPKLLEDSRLSQVRALIDDARCIVADLLDEIPQAEWPARHYLHQSRNQMNAALSSLGILS